jgi:type IV pilus assembly protein PilO
MTNAAASGTEEVVGGGLTLFGVTFTSKVLGIIMGIGGIGLGIYLATNYVTPLWDQVQSGQTNISTKKTAVGGLEQKIVGKGNVLAKIEEAKKQNQFVLSLLPNVDNIDTLMRDIQEQIPKTITISLPPDFSYELAGTMRNFQPTPFVPGPQYKTYSFTIGFDGKFEDVLNTIQKIERLKPLLVVKNLTLTKKNLPIEQFKFSRPLAPGKEKELLDSLPPLLGADFTLEAFVPLTEAELKAAATAPPKK